MTAGKISAVAAVVVFIAASVVWEVSIWRERRADHSWFYCMRVLH